MEAPCFTSTPSLVNTMENNVRSGPSSPKANSECDEEVELHCEGNFTNVGENLDGLDDEEVELHCEEKLTNVEENLGGMDRNLDRVEPYIGMEFASHQEAKSFYLMYAKSVGFGASIKASRRSKKQPREFIDVKFACIRHGHKQTKNVSNPRPCLKIDCKATLHVKKKDNNKWIVHDYIKEHNHELLPSYACYFPCHSNISLHDKNTVDDLHVVGVKTSTNFAAMAKQHEGYENIGFMEKDIRNHLDKDKCLELESGDAKAMLEHFMHMQEENPSFFYAIDFDENNRLKNVFWVDAKGREDYKVFADVISFDTTYITNKYKMPFAPFIGVNNHFQSTLLGCALLANETTSTFVWLMQTWIRAMGGKAPNFILTDQGNAMKSAIAQIFPNSHHRFCLWHILRKIPEKLGHVIKKHENFMNVFNKCVYNSWTCEEFEKGWLDMIEKFNLEHDEWLDSLYKDRSYWVPTYMRGTFFGGMSTTQRSKSINSFFDKYVNKKTSLKEFIEQYKLALQDREEKEAQADFITWHKQPALKSPSPFEKKMSNIYTHEIFKRFQVEILGTSGCFAKKESDDNIIQAFRVIDLEKKYEYKVTHDATNEEIYCGCHLFEYSGFLCRHAILVLQSLGIFEIPTKYILERWTKNVKSVCVTKKSQNVSNRKQRFDELFHESIKLCKEGSISQESFEIAFHELEETFKRCKKVNQPYKGLEEPQGDTIDVTNGNACGSIKVLGPMISKTKGYPKRIKARIEKKNQIKGKNQKQIVTQVPNSLLKPSCIRKDQLRLTNGALDSTSDAPVQHMGNSLAISNTYQEFLARQR